MEGLTESLSPAEKHYLSIKRAVKKYQDKNREKVRESCKNWFCNLKADTEKYKEYLEEKKIYMRQRRLNKKVEQNSSEIETKLIIEE